MRNSNFPRLEIFVTNKRGCIHACAHTPSGQPRIGARRASTGRRDASSTSQQRWRSDDRRERLKDSMAHLSEFPMVCWSAAAAVLNCVHLWTSSHAAAQNDLSANARYCNKDHVYVYYVSTICHCSEVFCDAVGSEHCTSAGNSCEHALLRPSPRSKPCIRASEVDEVRNNLNLCRSMSTRGVHALTCDRTTLRHPFRAHRSRGGKVRCPNGATMA
jgi:hypothetical protein